MMCRKLPSTRLSLLLASCLVLAGLLLLAACSGGGAGGGSTGGQPTSSTKASEPTVQPPSEKTAAPSAKVSLDACSLLTKQEVEAATGTQVLDPQPEGEGVLVSCNYNDPKHPDFNVVSLNVLIGTDASDAKDAFETGKQNSGGAPAIDGLGDGAFWLEPIGDLEVLKSKYAISIWVFVDAGDRLSIAKGLATKVLGRLS